MFNGVTALLCGSTEDGPTRTRPGVVDMQLMITLRAYICEGKGMLDRGTVLSLLTLVAEPFLLTVAHSLSILSVLPSSNASAAAWGSQ